MITGLQGIKASLAIILHRVYSNERVGLCFLIELLSLVFPEIIDDRWMGVMFWFVGEEEKEKGKEIFPT